MLTLLLALMISVLWAHPFESQFVGHKIHLLVSKHRVEATFELEVPLPLVERAFKESGQADKEVWLADWMIEQQSDMVNNLWLDINGTRIQTWSLVEHSPPMWQESSKFLVFENHQSFVSTDPLESVSVLDQVWLGEQSVYWTEVDVTRWVKVLATDQIEWTTSNRYTTRLKRWSMEERQREVRLAVDSNEPIQQMDAWWSTIVLKKEGVQSLKKSFIPRDFWREWILGQTPWWLALLSFILAVGASTRGKLRSATVVALLGCGLSAISIVPLEFRVGVMMLVGVASIVQRIRWEAIGFLLCMLCYPSWIVVVGWAFGLLCNSVKKWSIDKKNHLKT